MGEQTESSRKHSSLERGRIALEALHSREVAAQFHATSLELQLAMQLATSGDIDALDRWLETHRELLGDSKSVPTTTGGPHFFNDASNNSSKFPAFESSSESNANAPESSFGDHTESHNANPWLQMVEGARSRTRELSSKATLHEVTTSEPDHIKTKSNSNELDKTILNLSSQPACIDKVQPVANKASDANLGFGLDTRGSAACADSESEPIIIASSLQAAFHQPADNASKKSFRRWFLSSSVLGSAIVHFVVLVGMSVYVIRIATTTESKSIVASSSDTQEVSMEAPTEFSPPDSEHLDTSEPAAPSLPSFAAQATETTSASIQLPVSMVGVSLEKSPTTASEAAQQATTISKSNASTNMAEFFGVKAAGNTFCYLVDCSPSMKKDNAFAAAKAQVVRSITALKPKQRFFISFFGKDIEDLTLEGRTPTPFPVYANQENLQKALHWIERVRVQENGKAPTDALKKAIEMDPDGIFLLFDGDTTVDVAAFLRKTNRTNDIITGDQPLVPIHTLGFYDEDHQALMKRIAQENLGTFRFIPNPNKK
jgi:von Willebrand factor type A domain